MDIEGAGYAVVNQLVAFSVFGAYVFFLAAVAIRAFLSTLKRMRHYIRAVEVTER